MKTCGNEKAPKSPVELTIHIGAESWERLVDRLDEFAAEIRTQSETNHSPEGRWGGAGTNGSYSVMVIDKTPEQYREELHNWWENLPETPK
jgi:hypothetical protein